MALFKTIKQADGVETNYHRILYIQSVINNHDSIAVLSYIDQESRLHESEENRPYKTSITYEKPYDESLTVKSAYDYLKTLPDFEDATDV